MNNDDQQLKVTVMGCGGSFGVPHIGNDWGKCDPNNPKNRRSRNALFVEKGDTKFIVDCGPDIYQQLNALPKPPMMINAALMTHAHTDHSTGLFELAIFKKRQNAPFDIYCDLECLSELKKMYAFMFKDVPNYTRLLEPIVVEEGRFTIGDVTIDAFPMDHGICTTYGYVFDEKVAYCTDVVEIPQRGLDKMRDFKLDTLIVECTTLEPAATHAHFDLSMSWAKHIQAKRTYLTDMRHHLDYQVLLDMCPDTVEPAYDGLKIIA